jgi:hypothetical protein
LSSRHVRLLGLTGSTAAFAGSTLSVGVFRGLVGLDAIAALEPAAEIDLGAPGRAERPVPWRGGLATDRTRPRRRAPDRQNGGHCRADIINARRFETARGRSRNRTRSRLYGRIGPQAHRSAAGVETDHNRRGRAAVTLSGGGCAIADRHPVGLAGRMTTSSPSGPLARCGRTCS